jgi:hypothetical protein
MCGGLLPYSERGSEMPINTVAQNRDSIEWPRHCTGFPETLYKYSKEQRFKLQL